MNMGKIKRKNKIYGNCTMTAPDGTVMCRCDEKKANWYLDRNLATVMGEKPLVIRLDFEPKGLAHSDDPYYLSVKKNICVVCGSEDALELTKHHCVPKQYRKNFPDKLKKYNSHDIVSICYKCHEDYEMIALSLKRAIAREVGIELHVPHEYDNELRHITGLAYAVLEHGDKMPPERKADLIKEISDHFEKEITEEELREIAGIEIVSIDVKHVNHGKFVVEQLGDIEAIEAFVQRWRKHFVDMMKPKFLPDYWDECKPLKSVTHP